MGKTLLITGHPGSGKTTVIRKVIQQLGQQAGGFYTEEIFGPGGRQGFRLITLAGQEAILAHKDIRGPKVPKVSRYGVDVAALERVGIAALKRAQKAGKILVVDEIGKMELLSEKFQETVLDLILGPTPVLGTIVQKPYVEAEIFKGLAQVTLWELSFGNRDTMPDKIMEWIKKLSFG